MLSVLILTRNESRHIKACLDSVKGFADELIVFDSSSTDDTVSIAHGEGARVVEHEFVNFALQRNAAIEAARGEWIFFIDADERAAERVGREICETIASASGTDSLALAWIPRKNIIFGKWIKHTGWSPDYQPRLLRRGKAHFDTTHGVHELVIANGDQVYLSEPLTHFNYENIGQFLAKQSLYAKLEAQDLREAGIAFKWRSLIGQPLREFHRRLVVEQGLKDGRYGVLLSLLMGMYVLERQVALKRISQVEERVKANAS